MFATLRVGVGEVTEEPRVFGTLLGRDLQELEGLLVADLPAPDGRQVVDDGQRHPRDVDGLGTALELVVDAVFPVPLALPVESEPIHADGPLSFLGAHDESEEETEALGIGHDRVSHRAKGAGCQDFVAVDRENPVVLRVAHRLVSSFREVEGDDGFAGDDACSELLGDLARLVGRSCVVDDDFVDALEATEATTDDFLLIFGNDGRGNGRSDVRSVLHGSSLSNSLPINSQKVVFRPRGVPSGTESGNPCETASNRSPRRRPSFFRSTVTTRRELRPCGYRIPFGPAHID